MRVLLLLLSGMPLGHTKSSYAELFEEDQLGLTTMVKNARAFLRNQESRAGRRLTEDEMRKAYASQIATYRALESSTEPQEQVQAIRNWVRAVAPVLAVEEIDGIRYDIHGPLHLVLQKASEIL